MKNLYELCIILLCSRSSFRVQNKQNTASPTTSGVTALNHNPMQVPLSTGGVIPSCVQDCRLSLLQQTQQACETLKRNKFILAEMLMDQGP